MCRQISGNLCYGWNHNCIDVKQTIGALVKSNIVYGPPYWGSAFYYEDAAPVVTGSQPSITWQDNLAYNVANAFQCESGQSEGQNGQLYNANCRAYNNTAFVGPGSVIVSATTTGVKWDVRNNILDSSEPLYVCNTNNNDYCGEISLWDYNDDGGSQGYVRMAVTGSHDLIGVNPEYINVNGGNFHLQSGSRCIGAGQAALTPGNNDIGAF